MRSTTAAPLKMIQMDFSGAPPRCLICPGVAQAKTVARKGFESGGELLHYEGQKCVNLPCNTTNTVLQVLAMAMTPECNRVEEKSLEEMIMIMSVNVYISEWM